MSDAQDALRRIEANLERLAGIATPLGKVVFEGGAPYVKRNAHPPALECRVILKRGLVFSRTTSVVVEFLSLEAEGPVSLDGLRHSIVDRESRTRNRLDFQYVLALYSPEGWSREALDYVRNDPPGSGFTHQALHLILIGPEPTDVVLDKRDELLASVAFVFRGRTRDEDIAVAKEELERAVLVGGYASVERVASSLDMDEGTVLDAARNKAAEGGLKLDRVRGAGYVLRRTE